MADKYCMNCGTKLPPTAKFCPSCGTPFGAKSKTSPQRARASADLEEDGTDVFEVPDIDELQLSETSFDDLGIGGATFSIGGDPKNPFFQPQPFRAKRINR